MCFEQVKNTNIWMNTAKKMYMQGLFFDHKRIIEMTYSSVATICKHMDIYKCLNIYIYIVFFKKYMVQKICLYILQGTHVQHSDPLIDMWIMHIAIKNIEITQRIPISIMQYHTSKHWYINMSILQKRTY